MRNLVFLAGLALTALAAIGLPIAVAMSWPRVTTSLLALPGVVAAVVALEIYRRLTKNTLRWNRWHERTSTAIAELKGEVGNLKKSSVDQAVRLRDINRRIESSGTIAPLQKRLNRALGARAVKEGGRNYLNTVVQPLLNQAHPYEVGATAMWMAERHGLSVPKALSFRSQLITMSESKRVGTVRPSWMLNDKNTAYGFVDRLNVRRPDSDREAYPLGRATMRIPGVCKALHSSGSKGTYLLFSEKNIVHVYDGEKFDSIQAFRKHAEALMAGEGRRRPLRDEWMIEELILEDSEAEIPARNLKFYCFYGEVVLMQESRRNPNLEVAYWSADHAMVSTGRYESNAFPGLGYTPEQKEMVERISREIPFPFIRIDMLKGEREIVFGEFTPRPGNFDHFNDRWDRTMGEAWARAESRLLVDLLEGKTFTPFLDSTGTLGR